MIFEEEELKGLNSVSINQNGSFDWGDDDPNWQNDIDDEFDVSEFDVSEFDDDDDLFDKFANMDDDFNGEDFDYDEDINNMI